ncbi:MAG: molybdopterin-dependent oxidoreductase [Chloroflexota bacterium]
MNASPNPARIVARRFTSGALAIILALVCSSLVAVVLRAPSPLEPAAGSIMDHTPISIAIPLLLRLGQLSRPLALLGAIAVSMLAGGLLGILYPSTAADSRPVTGGAATIRRIAQIAGALLATAGIAIYALLILPVSNGIVAAVEVVVYLLALGMYRPYAGYSPSRRAFLAHNARVLGGIAILIGLLYAGPWVHRFGERAAGRRLFAWRPPKPRRPGFDIAGLAPEVTPQAQFYVMDEDMQQPDLSLQGWSLSVVGLVTHPYALSFGDLLALRRKDEIVTQECVSNPLGGPLMSTALFSGVPLGVLLKRAGVVPAAQAVSFESADGHLEAMPLHVALRPEVMLVFARNGILLEREHGFPARVLIPGYYGFKSVKWLTTIRVGVDARQGHWETEGWNALPVVQTMARIDVVRAVPGGVLLAGVAFAGNRGIRAVQVRVDGRRWRNAELHTPALSQFSWVQWRLRMAVHGRARIEVRAIDGRGSVQSRRSHGQKPSGASGYASRSIQV